MPGPSPETPWQEAPGSGPRARWRARGPGAPGRWVAEPLSGCRAPSDAIVARRPLPPAGKRDPLCLGDTMSRWEDCQWGLPPIFRNRRTTEMTAPGSREADRALRVAPRMHVFGLGAEPPVDLAQRARGPCSCVGSGWDGDGDARGPARRARARDRRRTKSAAGPARLEAQEAEMGPSQHGAPGIRCPA